MPRSARPKLEEGKYHIMSRSISEINLFRCDEDKSYYLRLLKKYKEKFHFKIYAFCLMDNHVHIYIDPCGFDISTIMLCLNTAYVTYYNKRYNRHGHLFQGRFGSLLVDNETYSLTLTAYIHNNPKDLPGFEKNEELYRYSSYGIYTGAIEDIENILDSDFILHTFSNDNKIARMRYKTFTEAMKNTGIMKQIDDEIMHSFTENVYQSGKKIIRNLDIDKLLQTVKDIMGSQIAVEIRFKYCRKYSSLRAFVTYLMRVLCGYSYRHICEYLGNMSISGVSRLCSKGFNLIEEKSDFKKAFMELSKA